MLDPEIVSAVRNAIEQAMSGVIWRWTKQPPNAPLFLLCRELLTVPKTATMQAEDLLPYVAMYWDAVETDCSAGYMDATDAESEFVVLWKSGKVEPPAANRLLQAVQEAESGENTPPENLHYQDPSYRKLVHVCHALSILCADGILKLIARGSQTSKKANTYQYCGDCVNLGAL